MPLSIPQPPARPDPCPDIRGAVEGPATGIIDTVIGGLAGTLVTAAGHADRVLIGVEHIAHHRRRQPQRAG
jgi:hypothetical protein